MSQFFRLFLVEVENGSLDPVLTSLGRKIQTVQPEDSKKVNLLTPDENHAFKLLMVQNNDGFSFDIFKTAHQLKIHEGVSNASVILDVVGGEGKFKIRIEDSSSLSIEDQSGAFTLSYKGRSTRFYRFVSSASGIDVRPSNN